MAEREGQKKFCCVTTRGRNRSFWAFAAQRRRLTAGVFGLSVLDFGGGVLASSGLSAGGLPAMELAAAFGVLAVALVPASWLIAVPTAMAQADPGPQSSRSFPATGLGITMRAAHGSVVLPRDSPGGTCPRSPRAILQPVTNRSWVSLARGEGTRQ